MKGWQAWRERLSWSRAARRAEAASDRAEDALHYFNTWVRGWGRPAYVYRREVLKLERAIDHANRLRAEIGIGPLYLHRHYTFEWDLCAYPERQS